MLCRSGESAKECRCLHYTQNPRPQGSMSEIAFHEKAGRSQVDSCRASLNTIFLPPSGRCRHASIRTLEERFVSLGACWAFSVQPVLPSVWRPVVLLLERGTWARRLTQSPELGFCLFLFLERFWVVVPFLFYAAAATFIRQLLCNGSYTSPLTHR